MGLVYTYTLVAVLVRLLPLCYGKLLTDTAELDNHKIYTGTMGANGSKNDERERERE